MFSQYKTSMLQLLGVVDDGIHECKTRMLLLSDRQVEGGRLASLSACLVLVPMACQ
jgi:hypothetical protein